jgi:hypothetical protein
MGYDLLAAIGFAILLPAVVLGFVGFWALTHRERQGVEDSWRDYAARRGLAFREAEGDWPNRSSPSLEWTLGTTRFRLLTMGREARAHTRLVVEPAEKILGTLVVVASAAPALRVRATPAVLEARLLDDAVRRALLAFKQLGAVSLAYRRGRVVIEWRGRETREARLDEARALGEAVARAVEAGFGAATA